MVVPFVLLLLSIALLPFINKRFWEHHYPRIAIGLGLISVAYYVFVLHNAPRMLTSLIEYVGFMALIGSLFVIAGGIHINMTGRSTPAVNTGLLAVGALLANLIGTTGASMLLIRPFLRINKYRAAPFHVVFFIFIVSNIGGALTPIGDPPLFLGYLKGVPFFWLLKVPQVVLAWLFCVAALLVLFFLIDLGNFQKHKNESTPRGRPGGTGGDAQLHLVVRHHRLGADAEGGMAQGAWGLAGVRHDRPGPGLGRAENGGELCDRGHRRVDDRHGVALAHVCQPGRASRKRIQLRPGARGRLPVCRNLCHDGARARPLEKHAADIGITTVRQFFWGSGALSSVLDNAPTYLNFLTAAFGLQHLSLENPVTSRRCCIPT